MPSHTYPVILEISPGGSHEAPEVTRSFCSGSWTPMRDMVRYSNHFNCGSHNVIGRLKMLADARDLPASLWLMNKRWRLMDSFSSLELMDGCGIIGFHVNSFFRLWAICSGSLVLWVKCERCFWTLGRSKKIYLGPLEKMVVWSALPPKWGAIIRRGSFRLSVLLTGYRDWSNLSRYFLFWGSWWLGKGLLWPAEDTEMPYWYIKLDFLRTWAL